MRAPIRPAALCAIASLVAWSCRPYAPQPTPNPNPGVITPTPGPPRTVRPLTGIVSTAGMPVSGASVLILRDNGSALSGTITGDDGAYAFPEVERGCSSASCVMISASKAGFIADIQYPELFDRLDLALQPVSLVSVGDVLGPQPANHSCAGLGYGLLPCQRFSFRAPAAGMIEARVTGSAVDYDVDVVNADGTFALYQPSRRPPFTMAFSVVAGQVYEVRLVPFLAGGTFTLTTAMKPSAR